MFHLVRFYKNEEGAEKVFPVSMFQTEGPEEQARRIEWMQIGRGAGEDWRTIETEELQELLDAGKVELDCFTDRVKAEKIQAIRQGEKTICKR